MVTTSRPAVDVVVPFLGPQAQLDALATRLRGLRLGARDTLTIVDNRPDAEARAGIVAAPERQTPAHARNVGAAAGSGEWIVFVDADTVPEPELLDAYFATGPDPGTGLLAGGVAEAVPPAGGREPLAARWSRLTGSMSQETTLDLGRFAFAQTANCAVRRVAFEGVDGFRGELRACEDADLCFRLAAAGWAIERREAAAVAHNGRATLRGLLDQQLVHGAGIGWLEREYPGAAPPHRWPGYLFWGARHAATGLARARSRDAALVALLDPVVAWTREFGRRRENVVR